tara:strand:- start:1721 stop:2269 length:549 start_codon:yes stop_codon:yes gene_type:complete
MFSSFFTILSVASSVSSAFANRQQAAAMKAYYDAQADVSRLQYESKRIEAKEQGVAALKNTNRAIAAIVAKAAAGGVLSTSGSALLGQTISLAEGARDLRTSQLNQSIFSNMGAVDFQNLKAAGEAKLQTGTLGALAGLGTDLTSGYMGGLFSDLSKGTPATSQAKQSNMTTYTNPIQGLIG